MRSIPWRRPRRRGEPPCVGCAEARAANLVDARHTIDAEVGASLLAVPVRGEDEQIAVIDDQLVLLNAETGRFHVLSTSAALVYTSVDGKNTVAEIAESLADEMDLSIDVVTPDVRTAVGSLNLEGLVGFAGEPDHDDPEVSDVDRHRATRTRHWEDLRERRLNVAEWPETIGPFVAGGAVVELRFAEPEVRQRLADTLDLLPPAPPGAAVDCSISVTGRADRGPYRVFLGGQRLTRTTDLGLAVETVLGACNQAAALAPVETLRLHAGVVARAGRAIVICGESGRGKSSLTTALVMAGWDYVTDEVAIIDPRDRTLVPYPKWIDLNSDSVEMLGIDPTIGLGDDAYEHHLPPGAIGSVASGRPQLAAVVILSATVGDGDATRMAPIAGVDALIELLRHVFAGSWDDPDALQHLADVCAEIPIVKLGRSGFGAMIEEVSGLLDRHR